MPNEESKIEVDAGEEDLQLVTQKVEEEIPRVTIVDDDGNRLKIAWRFYKPQSVQEYVGYGKLYSERKYCADAVILYQYATYSNTELMSRSPSNLPFTQQPSSS